MEIDIKDEHLKQLLEVKLRQLDLEMTREKERVETEFITHSRPTSSGFFSRALGLVEVEFSNKKQELILEFQQKDKEKQTQQLPESSVKFQNESLFMLLPDGTTGTITFSSKRGARDMLEVFEIMFGLWKLNAELNGGWWKVVVTKDQLRQGLQAKGKSNISDSFLKDTIGNIRKFKIEQSNLSSYASIGYYDRKLGGWPFKIKVPQQSN